MKKSVNPDSFVGYSEAFINPIELAEYILANKNQFSTNSRVFIHQAGDKYTQTGNYPVVEKDIIITETFDYCAADSFLVDGLHIYLSIL